MGGATGEVSPSIQVYVAPYELTTYSAITKIKKTIYLLRRFQSNVYSSFLLVENFSAIACIPAPVQWPM